MDACSHLEINSRLHRHAIFGKVLLSDTCRTRYRYYSPDSGVRAVSFFFFSLLRHGKEEEDEKNGSVTY